MDHDNSASGNGIRGGAVAHISATSSGVSPYAALTTGNWPASPCIWRTVILTSGQAKSGSSSRTRTARTQHVTVGRLDDEPEARPTTWLFEEGPELRLSDTVYCVCVSDLNKTEACISKYSSPNLADMLHPRLDPSERSCARWGVYCLSYYPLSSPSAKWNRSNNSPIAGILVRT